MDTVANLVLAAFIVGAAFYVGYFKGWYGCRQKALNLIVLLDMEKCFNEDALTEFMKKYEKKGLKL